MNSPRLLERFLNYVRIDTTADPTATKYPSSAGQWELGRLLLEELTRMGAEQVEQDAQGLVWATLPARVPQAPPIAWNAHLDTSPETTGRHVQPQVISAYPGGDLSLPGGGQVIRVADNPELESLVSQTLITTDGTTLLGADDKAGVAVIMEAAECLFEQPQVRHGEIRLLFTCDEEIGRGVDYVDLQRLGAVAAYTLDGPAAGTIDVETFSADLAVVTVRGVNIHPAIAQGRMVNAVRAASELVTRLPRQRQAPEATSGRDGFLHPYHLQATVEGAQLKILLRDFETEQLERYAQQLHDLAQQVEREFPGAELNVSVRKQYRNLREGLEREPRAVAFAEQAYRRIGITARRSIIRGGTDGSQLTERGLPTPNLSTGQHNPHSPLEWACLQEMELAVRHLLSLAEVWAEGPFG